MGIPVVSVPAPPHLASFQFSHVSTNTRFHSSTILRTHPFKRVNLLSSSTVCLASVVEEGPPSPPPQPDDSVATQSDSGIEGSEVVSLRGCKACGREEVEKGCNGEGRIQGGIATIPGFGWWPIKAYRPCPGFLASGGRYKRSGQSMDEVAFGRGGRGASFESSSEVQSRKQKQRR
ncbi:hypothetical protein UlMin_002457 [Ulmus minor]